MTKAVRQIKENLSRADIVIEVLDARIPLSSRNPMIDDIVGKMPRLIVLNKADLADPNLLLQWEKAHSPMLVTPSGIVTLVRLLQL